MAGHSPAYIATLEEQKLFDEQQRELERRGVHMPEPLGYTPYLKEKKSGFVHPYSAMMAARSDLVVGCYNQAGSMNPKDADPTYDPTDFDSTIVEPPVIAPAVPVTKSVVADTTAADKRKASAAKAAATRARKKAEQTASKVDTTEEALQPAAPDVAAPEVEEDLAAEAAVGFLKLGTTGE